MRILELMVVISLCSLAATPGTAALPLGRLFMTPEQRQALDAARVAGGDVLTDAVGLAIPDSTPMNSQVVLSGVVRRSRGPDVVWVNGTRTNARLGQSVQVRRGPDRDNRVTLENAQGTLMRLKPGQFWDPATGRVADCSGCPTSRKVADLVSTPPEPVPAPAPAAGSTVSPTAIPPAAAKP